MTKSYQFIGLMTLLLVVLFTEANCQSSNKNYNLMNKRAQMLRIGKRLESMANSDRLNGEQIRLLHRPFSSNRQTPFRFQNLRFRNENGDLLDDNQDLKASWREFLDNLYSENDSSSSSSD